MRSAAIWGPRIESEEYWISISDLMAGLMAIFLFIAISYMLNIKQILDEVQGVATSYDSVRVKIYEALQQEFRDDLAKWGAELDPSLVVRFNEPEVLFEQSSDALQPMFREILDDFFPRYVAILTREEFRDEVSEVRIEGHTSSEWRTETGQLQAYLNNMDLSQARTSNVLSYVLQQERVRSESDWVRSKVISIGFSSSRPSLLDDGSEDLDASRRVDFQVMTKAQERLEEIMRKGEGSFLRGGAG